MKYFFKIYSNQKPVTQSSAKNKLFIFLLLATTSSFFYGLGNPIHSYLNNRLIDSGERATVNSVSNLAQKLLFAAYAPILGFMADQWGVIRAIQISTLILSINIILISRLKQLNSTLTT